MKRSRLSFKKIKKMLGKANPDKRAAHVEQLSGLFEKVSTGEVVLVYIDEAHFHRGMDPGYGWGRVGKRIWRKSGRAKLSERLNCYGAYDFSNGESLLWEDGWCDGERTVKFLRELKRWREGKAGKLVVIWDNTPCHAAKVVKAEAARLGIELVFLPGYSPDLNPIERLWGWMRQEVTRGHCHGSVAELTAACQAFIAAVNQDPVAVVDRLWPVFELDPGVQGETPDLILILVYLAPSPKRPKRRGGSQEHRQQRMVGACSPSWAGPNGCWSKDATSDGDTLADPPLRFGTRPPSRPRRD